MFYLILVIIIYKEHKVIIQKDYPIIVDKVKRVEVGKKKKKKKLISCIGEGSRCHCCVGSVQNGGERDGDGFLLTWHTTWIVGLGLVESVVYMWSVRPLYPQIVSVLIFY